jgi:Protein of unknown function (DUF3224)
VGRLTIAKQFGGDLQATSRGQMLTALTPVQGSAGYVAIEPVSGTLEAGRMAIIIADGKHSYELDYTLPAKP